MRRAHLSVDERGWTVTPSPLTDPRAGDKVRSTPWERVVVGRDKGNVQYRMLPGKRVFDCTLYQWREAMRICKYEVVS